MRIKILLIFILFFTQTTYSQVIDSARLSKYLDILDSNNMAMLSISINKNNTTIYSKQFGYADTSFNKKVDSDSRYAIGSITKMFTACMIGQLIDEKKLQWNTKLSQFLPQIQGSENITIKHMLYHQSGLYNYTDDSLYLKWHTNALTLQGVIDKINKHGLQFKAGEKQQYSNTNYFILGFIIETLTRDFYASQLQKRIVKPLLLNHTQAMLGPSLNPKEVYSFKAAFGSEPWEAEALTHSTVCLGAGNIVSNTNDLHTFIQAYFQNKLVSDSTFKKIKTIDMSRGAGMIPIPYYKRWAYGHTGGIDGFHSVVLYFPDDSVSLALLCNGLDYNMNDIIINSLNAYYNKKIQLPTTYNFVPDRNKQMAICGYYDSDDWDKKINISLNGKTLFIQADGQDKIKLNAVSNENYESNLVGVKINFESNDTFVLEQGGKKFQYKKIK